MPKINKDYDALAAKEAEENSIGFRAAGEWHELPPQLPARLVMDVQHAMKTGEDLDDEEFGYQIIERLLGRERWERIVNACGIGTVTAIVEDVMEAYGFGGSEDGEDGDPKGEEDSPSTTSSNIGEPSTPTSNVFGLIPAEGTTTEAWAGTAS